MDGVPLRRRFSRCQKPLATEDIAQIEEVMDFLLTEAMQDQRERRRALALPLPQKIWYYLALAEGSCDAPTLNISPHERAVLRTAFTRINDTYRRCR